MTSLAESAAASVAAAREAGWYDRTWHYSQPVPKAPKAATLSRGAHAAASAAATRTRILALLADQPMTRREMIAAMPDISVSMSTIQRVTRRLVSDGHATATEEPRGDPGQPTHIYAITDAGREALEVGA